MVLPVVPGLMTPPRGVVRHGRCVAIFVVALVVARRLRGADRLPQAGGHRLLRRRRAQPARGPRPVSDALWSYQTPPLSSRGPAFEVWLPLPTFLAAIPMALFGPTFAGRAGARSVIVGALVPVLAWRLAADVAAERGSALERARWLAHRRPA